MGAGFGAETSGGANVIVIGSGRFISSTCGRISHAPTPASSSASTASASAADV
jgi:hypothetical protein